MQGNIDFVPRRRSLAGRRSRTSCITETYGSLIQEGIKSCRRVRIHESLSQSGLADNVSRLNFLLVPGITETRFPVPCLEVIAKFAHLTAKADVKKNIVKGGLRKSVTQCQSAIANAANHRGSCIRRARRQGCLRYRQRIGGSLKWHT